jgi:hypothetical protein
VTVPTSAQPPANYTLCLEFSGRLTGGIQGFYRSIYRNAEGREVPIATSKFQPTHARKECRAPFFVTKLREIAKPALYLLLNLLFLLDSFQFIPSQKGSMGTKKGRKF